MVGILKKDQKMIFFTNMLFVFFYPINKKLVPLRFE